SSEPPQVNTGASVQLYVGRVHEVITALHTGNASGRITCVSQNCVHVLALKFWKRLRWEAHDPCKVSYIRRTAQIRRLLRSTIVMPCNIPKLCHKDSSLVMVLQGTKRT